jgi:hypothetical protein
MGLTIHKLLVVNICPSQLTFNHKWKLQNSKCVVVLDVNV